VTTVIPAPALAPGGRRLGLWAAGAALITGFPFLVGLPLFDTVQLIGLAAGGAGLVTVITAVVARSLRSVRGLLVLTALIPVAATVVGAAVASRQMFLSDHDLRALYVMLAVSGGVGLATAIIRGDRVVKGTAAVADLARAVDGGPVRLECRGLPDELQSVAD